MTIPNAEQIETALDSMAGSRAANAQTWEWARAHCGSELHAAAGEQRLTDAGMDHQTFSDGYFIGLHTAAVIAAQKGIV